MNTETIQQPTSVNEAAGDGTEKAQPSRASAIGSAFVGNDYAGPSALWTHSLTGDQFLVIAPDVDALKRVLKTIGQGQGVDETMVKRGRLVAA